MVWAKGHVRERGEVCMGFLSGNLRERIHLENVIVDVRIILNVVSRNRLRGRGLSSAG